MFSRPAQASRRLAAQTERLRLGALVTSNRFWPPAMLAKIAATVDVVAGGRLDFGNGAGSRPGHPLAMREYAAHGPPAHDSAYAVGSLAAACTVIHLLWTEAGPFDFHGTYVDLTGAFCNRPAPGTRGARRRLRAHHARSSGTLPGKRRAVVTDELILPSSAPRP